MLMNVGTEKLLKSVKQEIVEEYAWAKTHVGFVFTRSFPIQFLNSR